MYTTTPPRIAFNVSPNRSQANSHSPSEERFKKVVVVEHRPIQSSPAQEIRIIRNPVQTPSPTRPQSVIVENRTVIDNRPVQMSPFSRIQTINRQEMGDNIFAKLEQINGKLKKGTELEIENTYLKEQNAKLKSGFSKSDEIHEEREERE